VILYDPETGKHYFKPNREWSKKRITVQPDTVYFPVRICTKARELKDAIKKITGNEAIKIQPLI
jgi:hypothetical protein